MASICEEIIGELSKQYSIRENEFVGLMARSNLFELIIAVLLSQNTSDKNAIKAFTNLKNELGELTPEKILAANIEKLSELIKPAGLHLQRARNMVEIARRVIEYGGIRVFEEKIKNIMNLEESRNFLKNLPGVGDKTADVILLMYFNRPTFPVDTHIRRITQRLGLVGRGDYKSISRYWASCLPPELYLKAHLLLIIHGRRVCRARKPLCDSCPISKYCAYYNRNRGRDN
ncbi:endonuclease III domain-containing protein [Thermogladius sp. 4427co]|uniref:endonuclease III domain-containing protein n=1 Tax=Thermogladius sp. 4427co TaxID=3450718 RepID=UPI003F7AF40D